MRRLLAAMAFAAVGLATLPAAASGAVASAAGISVPADASTVIARMMQRNASLQSFTARVHVGVRMLNFPYLAPKLDGTSYYKRPNTYVVVFDRMPSYAKGFSRLFDDVGDPQAWQKDENVTLQGTATIDGRPAIVLRLTKKVHSDILDHTLAYVDLTTYTLVKMEWYYRSGGKIAMSQQYRKVGRYTVLASQHATIDIPHVRAVADASYGDYQTNVAVVPAEVPSP